MNWPYCLSLGTSLLQDSQPPLDKARSLTFNHGERVPPKTVFIHAFFLTPSVDLYGLGILLSICVNVNVDPTGIYSNFYCILFYFV